MLRDLYFSSPPFEMNLCSAKISTWGRSTIVLLAFACPLHLPQLADFNYLMLSRQSLNATGSFLFSKVVGIFSKMVGPNTDRNVVFKQLGPVQSLVSSH